MSADECSSNYRELRNLVESLEKSGSAGELEGKEIFVFMDNSTAEAVIHKGSSSSPLLYELVVRLYKLSSSFLCSVQVIHVAGTRMVSHGTDGLSRGDMLEGVLQGREMLSYIPLHRSALEQEPTLRDWFDTLINQTKYPKAEFLKPSDWFIRGHDIVVFRKIS